MPNIKSAKKRVLQNLTKTTRNHNRKSRIRTFMRSVREAITAGDKQKAETALKQAQPEMMRGVTKGIFHKNTISRCLSRFSSKIKALG